MPGVDSLFDEMLDLKTFAFQPLRMPHLRSLVFYATILLACETFHTTIAVEISPSKYPGGNTNLPYRTEGAPSLLKNPFKWIFGNGDSSAMRRVNAPPNFKVQIALDPKEFVHSTNIVVKARMTIFNQGKDKYVLEFETAQHHEFTIRNKEGKEVYRSSADKVFSQQPSSLVVNRNEKLVFEEDIISPDAPPLNLTPGSYTLTGCITAKKQVSAEIPFQIAP